MTRPRKTLTSADITVIADTREQLPYSFAPMNQVTDTLTTGDYSVRGLEHVIRVERKSLEDFLSCVGAQRERFQAELVRLLAFPVRVVVVEASRRELEAGGWRSKVLPQSVIGSLLAWQAMGIPFHLAGNRQTAQADVARLLFGTAKRAWTQLQAFSGSLRVVDAAQDSGSTTGSDCA